MDPSQLSLADRLRLVALEVGLAGCPPWLWGTCHEAAQRIVIKPLARQETDVTHDAHLKALGNFKEIQEVLLADVALARSTDPSEDSPEKRRRYVRNGVAMVEGVTAAMRRIALADAEAGLTQFDAGEVVILRGRKYELDDEGRVWDHPDKQRLTRIVRFSFAAMARTYGFLFTLEVGGNGWRCLRGMIEVRNRLVHPKTSDELIVSGEEIRDASIAAQWFVDECLRIGELVIASLSAMEAEAEEQ